MTVNIILCGFPMSGKTTIGKELAKQLCWRFIDIDLLIEQAYTTQTNQIFSCRQIYLEHGEDRFRELEKQQIASLLGSNQSVIALGGGSLIDPENRDILKLIGSFVYLKTPLSILWKRTQRKGCPAYLDRDDPKKAFYLMADKRMHLYESIAHTIINTCQLNKHEIVVRILKSNIKG